MLLQFLCAIISIHAPTRGATLAVQFVQRLYGISIHAPTRGATTNTVQGVTPTGISIHAPTRGATKILRHTPKGKQFQSTLPRGERHVVGIPFKGIWDFNPRSHEGSDNSNPSLSAVRTYFNPRSHEGSDLYYVALCTCSYISIHAPTRGATHSFRCLRCSLQISIHAPTRGATFCDLNIG